MKFMQESLQGSDGLYSSKKLSTFISLAMCVLTGLADQFTAFKLNELVFFSFLGMASGQTALSVYSNVKHAKLESVQKSNTPIENVEEAIIVKE